MSHNTRVIKVYIYVSTPVLILIQPIKGVNLEWRIQRKQSIPLRLSASLYQHLSQRDFARSARLN